ncbi:MAG TPA: hypothetical protein VNC22_03695 [Sporichthya sp.]|jgi:hypothetical protein|nr:hypothetical protein [Sporichthya sp.]
MTTPRHLQRGADMTANAARSHGATPDDATPGGRPARHLVRPRWVWGGLVGALSGAAVLSVGVVLLSGPVSVTGTALLLVGVGCSVHGGVLYDAVSGFSPRRELRQVRAGVVHPGVAPGEMVNTDRAHADAAASNQRTRRLEDAAHHPAKAHWAPVAGWMCMLITATLVVSQWNLVAHNATGASNSFRDTVWAILLGLCGLRVAVVPGRHRIAAAVILISGLGLVLGGTLAEHDHLGLQLVEVTCGCLAVACALAAYLSPSPPK